MTRSTVAQLLAILKAISKGVASNTEVKILLDNGTEIRLDTILVDSTFCLHSGNTHDTVKVLATATPVNN